MQREAVSRDVEGDRVRRLVHADPGPEGCVSSIEHAIRISVEGCRKLFPIGIDNAVGAAGRQDQAIGPNWPKSSTFAVV